MPTIQELKSIARAAIEDRSEWLIDAARTILDNPEPGFTEVKTSRFVSEKMSELRIAHQSGIALTGLKGVVQGGKPGPTVAVIGELDSLRVLEHPHTDPETGAAHACGHHCQTPMMLGAAVGLLAPEVLESLAGNIAFIAVPAEEFIDVEYRWGLHQEGKLGLMAGKQEFIRLGRVRRCGHGDDGSHRVQFPGSGEVRGRRHFQRSRRQVRQVHRKGVPRGRFRHILASTRSRPPWSR